jgi:hypothetical protein
VSTKVKLSPEQERNIREMWDEGLKVGATPMELLSGVMTGGVEANYGNPDFGDRDSLGFFQQRPSQGWGTPEQVRDVRHASRRYFTTAKQMRQKKRYTRAGDLAADVQRPAEQYRGRYEERRGEALAIIAQLGLNKGPGGTSQRGGTSLAAEIMQGDPQQQAFDSTRGPVSMLEFSRPAQPIQVSAPAAPAVTAAAAMPGPYAGGAPMAGAPQPKPMFDVQDSLPDYSTSFEDPAAQQVVPGSDSAGSNEAPAAVPKGGAKPRVKIAAGANAAGRPMGRGILGVLDEISSASGRELVVTTGTNHSKMTKSGNVSEHYVGSGADLAMRGKQLTDTGVDSLLATGRGKTVQWIRNDGKAVNVRVTAANARKLVEAGGIFNVPRGKGRVQLIVNTHQGGDHTNHLHVGLKEEH